METKYFYKAYRGHSLFKRIRKIDGIITIDLVDTIVCEKNRVYIDSWNRTTVIDHTDSWINAGWTLSNEQTFNRMVWELFNED